MEALIMVVMALLIAAVSTAAHLRWRKQALAELQEITTVQERSADALAAAAMDSVPPPNDERRAQTAREQRELLIREREDQGLCRYCDERATKQYPTFEPVRPWFDAVLRYFNATPNNRWTIKLDRGSGVKPSLCEKHHEWQLGYFEEMVAQERAKASKFAADQRLLMYEFERYGSDERALDEMQSIRRSNGRKRAVAPKQDAQVINLQNRKRAENG
jgi:hypothetical protein